jgi:2-hydroxychromene-2-carboxylate isomerase
MAAATREAGVELAGLRDFARANPERLASVLARNEEAQMAHHWGVPLMVLDDEPFFGQDRLDSLVWRLDQKGSKKKAARP